MNEVGVGVTLPQFKDDASELIDGARRAVDAGFDSLWVFDHLWPLGAKRRPILECWSCLAYLAAEVPNVTVGSLVTRSTLRNPALVAKMAGTVSSIAPGRVVVGLGSGDAASRPENEAFGLAYHSGEDRHAQLASVVTALASYRDAREVDVSDPLVRIAKLPAHPVAPFAVWVGGVSATVLAVAARHADGYNCWGVPAETVRRRTRQMLDLADGRPIAITWGGQVMVGRSRHEAALRLGTRDPARFVTGDPAELGDRLAEVAEAGATHLIMASPFVGDPGTYELLARARSLGGL